MKSFVNTPIIIAPLGSGILAGDELPDYGTLGLGTLHDMNHPCSEGPLGILVVQLAASFVVHAVGPYHPDDASVLAVELVVDLQKYSASAGSLVGSDCSTAEVLALGIVEIGSETDLTVQLGESRYFLSC